MNLSQLLISTNIYRYTLSKMCTETICTNEKKYSESEGGVGSIFLAKSKMS
jgi:hypothetical protein